MPCLCALCRGVLCQCVEWCLGVLVDSYAGLWICQFLPGDLGLDLSYFIETCERIFNSLLVDLC